MSSKFEYLFCSEFAKKVNDDLNLTDGNSLVKNLEIRVQEKILYDITILYGGSGQFNPKFGFLEQDIVIGHSLHVPDNLGCYFYRANNRKQLFQPELVIEIKYGHVSTHQLITYSHIASKLKSVFPRCRYYLIIGYGSVSLFEKAMRHGTNFDQIYNLCVRRRSITKKQLKVPDYTAGKFNRDLKSDESYRNVYSNLIENIKNDLSSLKIKWHD